MAAYVIATTDTDELETVVFEVAESDEAVAVFTDAALSDRYIEDGGWSATHTTAEVQPIDFIEWLLECHHSGIKFMITDPNFADQEAGLELDTLSIEDQLELAGRQICLAADSDS